MNQSLEKGKQILRVLKANGYEAYFVGGYVRDFLLGLKSSDIDIATSALPNVVLSLFPKAIATGEKYGTISVYMDEVFFEVTTFRTEGEYLDSRHPEFVAFTNRLEDDLMRRDFTINAMAMDEDLIIIDRFESQTDLKNGLIRAIGNPDTRFSEDALRILRAFRFIAKLGFHIDDNTFESICTHKELLKHIAIERIMQELKLIVEGPYAILAIKAMAKANLGEVLESINLGLRLLSGKLDFSLSVNEFYALSFYLANCEIPDKWRFSNKDKALIERLIELVIVTSRDDFNEMIVYVNGLDLCLSANKINLLIFDGNDQSSLIQHLYDRMPIHKTCDLAFKGQDILQMGLLQDARMIGRLIDDITYQVITLQLPNDYDAIHHYVQQRLDNINDSGEKNGK